MFLDFDIEAVIWQRLRDSKLLLGVRRQRKRRARRKLNGADRGNAQRQPCAIRIG
jgi:hypothetical protein